ncbi:MAG: type I methionyl aminopeptidase [Candidatus Melainabacteria bacterium RIFOXYA12_FULL_32_12]|nr:MAG: type I methionyl aminopeptidase [Candidatus Melainabacteria bacterium RIFOXYA12_FULL_32_12]
MINRKSRYEISLMNSAGSIVAEVLQQLRSTVKPGITTAELDTIAENIIRKNNAIPAFKGYHGFPGTICASINEQVVHGIPSDSIILKEGDIISLDVGATYKGMVGDSAITVGVGSISKELEQLIEVTKQALYDAIEKMQPGNHLQDISGAIEDRANQYGYGIVKQYGGHGIGRNMHEEPFVFNYRTGDLGPILKPGMVMALEPMFNLGTGDVHTLSDNWTVVTNDDKHSAHYEHTVLISEDGPQILTIAK